MSRVRFYGDAPYKVVVIHGGPGAPGTVSDMARELGKSFGVMEPIQSKYSLDGLIEELREQITTYCIGQKVVLVGHSFGAWLAALYASRYGESVERLLFIGCPPLDAAYAKRINENRKLRLSKKEQSEWNDILSQLKQKEKTNNSHALERLGEFVERTDNYLAIYSEYEDTDPLPVNENLYANVWPQAEQCRKTGVLMEAFRQIACPKVFIQGEEDPHPIIGIEEPLKRCEVPYICHHLKKCGHSPWRELYARKEFYQILNREIEYEAESI